MPKKLDVAPYYLPTVQARTLAWGRNIRSGRVMQKITARNLCERLRISESTLRRVERGDPAVAAGTYLTALVAVGSLDRIIPLPEHSTQLNPNARARPDKDDEYF
ncbi:hypothetical protein DFR37_10455 [Eoetvoesiella caeni]|uniref:Helix-turn-helix protein n=1 Tax=Eoetvoesiella caeni TaxID=645616 RepID=A0A366HE70_9BURK|nr:hypothetical protein DFR37_10455 [Eoetvoesiella caeni]